MFEKARETYSFVGKFKICSIISGIICLFAIVSLILTACGIPMFNFDIDFAGGVTMEIELGTTVDRSVQEQVAAIYKQDAGVNASVTTAGSDGTAVDVKTTELTSEQRQQIMNDISAKFGSDKVSLVSTDFVSAAVGNDLKKSAVVATLLACGLILVYITIRFELLSGVAAILCLLHDVLIMVAFMAITKIPMNMTFIAAALTIVGYSINATIVVFDRVRENYGNQGKRGDFAAVIDKSIWQTMNRSIGTTVTTLLPVICIIIMGVTSIRIFALPLMVGIIAGGYSSTCLSGPIWNLLKGKKANA